MAININVNGESINYPQTGDTNWSDEATDFAVQTASAFGKIGLSSGTTVDIPGTLDVTGNTTLDANLSVGGNASVTGNTTLTGSITVNGNSNLTGSITVNGNSNLTGSITVNGNTTLGNGTSDTTVITGILNVDSGVLFVDPTTNKVGINDATPSEALDVTGNLNVTGDITLGGSLVGTTGNFTNTTDATDVDNAPLKTLGGMAVKKKLFVGTQLYIGDGNVSNPSMSLLNDPDTGLYRIGANNIGFVAGGAQTAQLNSLGVLNGTVGTDFRNCIKTQIYNSPFTTSYSIPTTATTAAAIGYNVSYTPLQIGSRLEIYINFPVDSLNPALNYATWFLYCSGAAIAANGTITGGAYANPQLGLFGGGIASTTIRVFSNLSGIYTFTTTSTSTLFINIISKLASANSGIIFNSHSGASSANNIIIREYI